MTIHEKEQIKKLRTAGMSISAIAEKLSLSINTVKSFCRRNDINPEDTTATHRCGFCGVPVAQTEGRKLKKFCSDKCRTKWWSKHADRMQRRTFYDFTCANCGKSFVAYGAAKRKYCCHNCYIQARFSGNISP